MGGLGVLRVWRTSRVAALDFGTQAFDTETDKLNIGDDDHMVLGTWNEESSGEDEDMKMSMTVMTKMMPMTMPSWCMVQVRAVTETLSLERFRQP